MNSGEHRNLLCCTCYPRWQYKKHQKDFKQAIHYTNLFMFRAPFFHLPAPKTGYFCYLTCPWANRQQMKQAPFRQCILAAGIPGGSCCLCIGNLQWDTILPVSNCNKAPSFVLGGSCFKQTSIRSLKAGFALLSLSPSD